MLMFGDNGWIMDAARILFILEESALQSWLSCIQVCFRVAFVYIIVLIYGYIMSYIIMIVIH